MRKILLAVLIGSLILFTASGVVSAGTLDDGKKIFLVRKINMNYVEGHVEKFPDVLVEKFPKVFTIGEWSIGYHAYLKIIVNSGAVTIGNTEIETPCTLKVFSFDGYYYMWDKIDIHQEKENLSIEALGFMILVS